MGTFEKLGILVIVVIIVMILAVAIYQWGGATEPASPTPDFPEPLTIRYLDELEEQSVDSEARKAEDPAPGPGMWPGGIPKDYVVQPNDKVWVLVVKRWKLKQSFVTAIANANPTVRLERIPPGCKLKIPDPSSYVRTPGAERRRAPGPKTRLYTVEVGDSLESIAYRHLGSRQRWKEIDELNPGLIPKRLLPGQEIYIPVK
jgi:LysM repeat protein